MKIIIQADEGDELTVNAFHLTEASGFVRLLIQSQLHEGEESDWVTLPHHKARELGCALISRLIPIAADSGYHYRRGALGSDFAAELGIQRMDRT
jgi:hypothetical protein